MTQWDILEYLQKQNGKAFTIEELCVVMKVNKNGIQRCCNKLRAYGYIDVDFIKRDVNNYHGKVKVYFAKQEAEKI